MTRWLDNTKIFLARPWVVAALLTAAYYLTHGYLYPWDDHRLEIPLLKALIDPTLYPRDYFIDILQRSFTTYFYIILSKLITINLIEPVYAVLFFVSRFAMFYWIYRFWAFLTGRALWAFCASLSFLVLLRYEMFYYLSFSHAEFALAFSFAGLYYFYRERFLLAAVILGIAANIHALFSAFVFQYMFLYLLIAVRKHGWITLLKTVGIYVALALPFLIWFISRVFVPDVSSTVMADADWPKLYRDLTQYYYMYGPLPFSELFKTPRVALITTQAEVLLVALYVFLNIHSRAFRSNMKNHALMLTAAACFLLSVYVCYVNPIKSILNLQLYRHEGFAIFLLVGYVTTTLLAGLPKLNGILAFLAGMLYFILGDKSVASIIAVGGLICLWFIPRVSWQKKTGRWAVKTVLFAAAVGALYGVFRIFEFYGADVFASRPFAVAFLSLAVMGAILTLPWVRRIFARMSVWFVIVPLLIYAGGYAHRHWQKAHRPRTEVEILRDDWKEMGLYVKENTPKDALFLIPYDMPFHHFRIYAERSIIFSWADTSIFAFDRSYAKEHVTRMKDIGAFRTIAREPIKDAVINAIAKYGADYIIFPTYNMPVSTRTLEKMHQTKLLSLYRVNRK